MIERMAKELKKAYSNLGLPETVLKSVAKMLIVGLAEDADDAVIASRASEDYVSEMLKTFQSHTDKVRTDAKKATQDNKGGNADQDGNRADVPDYIKALIDEQKRTNDILTKRVADLENANNRRTFEDLTASIGKELGLTGALLDLCKAGLSSDSDEKTIRDHLGSAKKTLIDSGAKIDDGTPLPKDDGCEDDEKLRKESEDWVKANAMNEG